MTKSEVIKKAWGEYYEQFKNNIDENGFIYYDNIPNYIVTTPMFYQEYLNGASHFRPKSLQGIENNNGWIKIESKEDLPKQDIDCFYIPEGIEFAIIVGCFRLSSYRGCKNMFTVDHIIAVGFGYVTHCKPIEKPKPPIY